MNEIHFECPKCSQSLAAPEELATQLINCPTCNETIEVPTKSRPQEPPQQSQIAQPAEQGNLNMIFGIAGAVILILGVFAPLVRVPTLGTMNYFANGKGDGNFFLIFAVVSLVLSVTRRYRGLWWTGIISTVFLVVGFINFQGLLNNAEKESATAKSFDVQLEWGWALLLVGTLLILAAAGLKPRKQLQR